MDTMVGESVTSANEGTDVGENPSLGDLGILSDGPASLNLAVGPPSPLTGCYLLIVIGEPYTQEHKDIILQKLLKGKFFHFLFNPITKFFYNRKYQLNIISHGC
jgi:hypothetical protein